jgi:broad specificity phosphatase PhoE
LCSEEPVVSCTNDWMPCTQTLWLLRHGETEWSRAGRHTGISDIPLTEAGEQQALRLAPALSDTSFSLVLSSPRIRAQRTCVLAGLGDKMEIEEDLVEWRYGAYEGMTSAEIHAQRPGWSIYTDGTPSGESPIEVSARADRLLAKLIETTGEIALFAHGHFLRVLALRFLGWPLPFGRQLELRTASIGRLATHSQTALPSMLEWNRVPGAR